MKTMKMAAIAAAGLALAGCATIIKGTTQSVSIDTPPVEGAHCTLVNSEGTWYITSPGSVVVHKTKNDLNVTCTKEGYQDAAVVVASHFNGATVGNVIAGGLIGVGIDAASGANYEYAPATSIPMLPVGAAAPTASAPAGGGATTASQQPTS